MKKIFSSSYAIMALVAATALLFSCTDKGEASASNADADSGYDKKDVSYAFGVAIGASIEKTGIEIDFDSFRKGFSASLAGKETRMTPQEADNAIQTALYSVMTKQASDNAAKGAEFLAENGKKAGITTTASGLQYEVITQGSGVKPAATDVVKVDYEGSLLDGTVFDSSIERGEPVSFPLNQVIPGWSEGLQLMNVGSTWKLYLPASIAYGEQGAGNVIPPNSTLVFKVTLLSIEEPAPAEPAFNMDDLQLDF